MRSANGFRFSLASKFILVASVFIVAALVIFGSYFERTDKVWHAKMFNDFAASLAGNLAYNCEYAVLIDNEEMLLRLAKGILSERDVAYVEINDPEGGRLAYVTKNGGSGSGSSRIMDVEAPIKTYKLPNGRNELDLLGLEEGGGGVKPEVTIGTVKVGMSMARADKEMNNMLIGARLWALSIIIVGMIIVAFLFKLITNPIRSLINGTRQISSGDYSFKMDVSSNDEIGDLASAFNEMTERLFDSRNKPEEYKVTLEAKVTERTAELNAKNEEMEKANKKLNDTKSAIINMMQDMKETQDKLRVLYEKEQEHLKEIAEVNKRKTEFVSDVSHELRTPLASIKGFTATMSGDPDMPAATRIEFLKIVEEETDRLSRLIDDLLDLSRIESGRIKVKMENVPIGEVALNCVDKLNDQAKQRDITVSTSISENVPSVVGDKDKVAQILINLLSNSIKYTKPGGKVCLLVKPVAGKVMVEVADTGIGISEKDLQHVFEKFYRVEKMEIEAKGTGLGLAIVKSLVELQGGQIFVESKPDTGSKFSFTLPAAERSERIS